MSNSKNIKIRGYLAKRKGMRNNKPYEYYYVQLVYTDDEGMKKKETCSIGKITKKSDAREEMEKLVAAKREELGELQVVRNDNRIVFLDSFRYWLESKKDTVEDNTYDGYVTRSGAIIRYFEMLTESRDVDAIYLDEVKSADILEFYKYELKYGKVNSKTGETTGLSRNTVLSYSGLLHNYYKDMVMQENATSNICDMVEVPRVKKDNTKTKNYMTMSQLKEFMDTANDYRDKRLVPIIKICVTYGCRRSEVLGLKWDAVDLENGTVEIKRTAVRAGNTVYYKDNTKSESSHRAYPMTEYIRNDLIKIKGLQEKDGYYRKDGLVFRDKEKEYSPDYMSKLFKKIIKKCDSIPDDFHFHDMRKTCATLLYESGKWSLNDIQLWIGHDSSAAKAYDVLLVHYLTVTMQWKRDKVPMLEELFKEVF